MPTGFTNLPDEIVEMVVCQLECRDICNLRLASRAIDSASTQAHFKSFFSKSFVRLDTASIYRFADITRCSRFTGLLCDLRLFGTQRSLESDCFTSEDIDVLCTAIQRFCHHHKSSSRYCLRSLGVAIREEATGSRGTVGHSPTRSAASAPAARAALRVVNTIGMPIEKLYLMYHPLACSVPCCIFEDPSMLIKPSSNWSALRCLALKLTYHAQSGTGVGLGSTEDELREAPPEASANAGTRRVKAIVDFFSLIPNIEKLRLYWFDACTLTRTPTAASPIERCFFDQVLLTVSFPKLKYIELRGLYLAQGSLQKVLTTPSLRLVHLEYIHISGALRPVLDDLTGPNTKITQFCLDDIYEQSMVHFAIEGRPKFPWSGTVPGPSTVLRKGEEVKLPLDYGFPRGTPLPSQELHHYMTTRLRVFGRL